MYEIFECGVEKSIIFSICNAQNTPPVSTVNQSSYNSKSVEVVGIAETPESEISAVEFHLKSEFDVKIDRCCVALYGHM